MSWNTQQGDSKLYDVNTNFVPARLGPNMDDGDDIDHLVPSVNDAPSVPATQEAHEGFSQSLYGSDTYVPAVAGNNHAAGQDHFVLNFTDSQLSHQDVRGKMQPANRAAGGSSPDMQRLVGQNAESSAAVNGAPAAQPQHGMKWLAWLTKYFDVDTEDVLSRAGRSLLGPFKANFYEEVTEHEDLYGPFWITTTLIFLTAMAGNVADYISYAQQSSSDAAHPSVWSANLNKVVVSLCVYYGYVFGLGFLLFAVMRWWAQAPVRLMLVWCIYGYALTAYIPVSLLCIIPVTWVRWMVVGIATLSSGLFLVMNLRPAFASAVVRAGTIMLATAAMHAGLGFTLVLYFFRYHGV